MDLQNLDCYFKNTQRLVRSQYHLTLGKAIETLQELPETLIVKCSHSKGKNKIYPGVPSSYRGYYADLAFEPTGTPVTLKEFLTNCKNSMNQSFEGYKGGNFVMGPETPLWISPYGIVSNLAIVDVLVKKRVTTDEISSIVLVTKQL